MKCLPGWLGTFPPAAPSLTARLLSEQHSSDPLMISPLLQLFLLPFTPDPCDYEGDCPCLVNTVCCIIPSSSFKDTLLAVLKYLRALQNIKAARQSANTG